MKLVSVKPAPKDSPKKWVANFQSSTGQTIRTQFGAKGYEDYTIHKNKQRRDRYRQRHNRDLKTADPTRAGYLSYYLLWGDSTDMDKNISVYRKTFNL